MRVARRELAQRRRDVGLSQHQLADRLGVGYSTVSRWERGVGGFPQPRHAEALAGVLGVSVGELRRLFRSPTDTDDAAAGSAVGSDGLWGLQRALHSSSVGGELLDLLEDDVVRLDRELGARNQELLVAEVDERLVSVNGWLVDPQPVGVRRRLVGLAGRLAGLRGCVLFDAMDHGSALRWFGVAGSAASEAEDVELGVWVSAFESLVLFDRGDTAGARDVLMSGVAAAGLVCPTVRAWLGLLLARCSAAAGDQEAFVVLSGEVNRLVASTAVEERRHGMDFTDAGVLDVRYYQGLSHAELGQYEKSRALLGGCLDGLAVERRRARSMLQASLASVSASAGEHDRAVVEMEQSLDLVDGAPAARVCQRLHSTRDNLASYTGVSVLDERLADAGGRVPVLISGL